MMDSIAYRGLIEKLLPALGDAKQDLPVCFVQAPFQSSPDSVSAACQFLDTITGDVIKTGPYVRPALCVDSTSFWPTLFAQTHRSIAACIQSGKPADDYFYRSGSELLKLFIHSSTFDTPVLFDKKDPLGCAMSVCLIEGLLHCGCSPAIHEHYGKYTAHQYFVYLRKSLSYANEQDLGSIYSYLCAAFIFAQKTEGIADCQAPSVLANSSFECNWTIADRFYTFHVWAMHKTGFWGIAPVRHTESPHIFAIPDSDTATGLFFKINQASTLFTYTSFEEIKRPSILGCRIEGTVTTPNGETCTHTIVFMVKETTVYRIDILKPVSDINITISDLAMTLHCPGSRGLGAGQRWIFKDLSVHTIVEFIESPVEFSIDWSSAQPLVRFASRQTIQLGSEFKLVTAWASGKNISELNKIGLLGIY